MRVLLKDNSDNSLFVGQVEYVSYDRDDCVLWFAFSDCTAVIPMGCSFADDYLRDLYRDGFVDLSLRPATFEWSEE